MSTVSINQNPEADPRVKAVFDDIRTTRKSDFINNMWLYLAFDPDLLEKTWAEVKAIMATPSALDPVVKEMLYIAVSATNGCSYCVHSHTAAAKAKGMDEAQHAELLSIISLAAKNCGPSTAARAPYRTMTWAETSSRDFPKLATKAPR